MKRSDIKALHQQSIKELQEQLESVQLELAKARLSLTANKLEDTSKVKRLAKQLARIKTILTEKRNVEQEQQLAQETNVKSNK